MGEAAVDLESNIHVGLSLMPSEDARLANEALFEEGIVDAIEWSVDFGWHGLDSAAPARLRGAWTRVRARRGAVADVRRARARTACVARRPRARVCGDPYRHLTEHYGFITAGDFGRGTPLPLPPSRAASRGAVVCAAEGGSGLRRRRRRCARLSPREFCAQRKFLRRG